MLAMRQSKAQNIFKFGTRHHGRGRHRIDIAIALIAGQKTLLSVKKHKTVRDGFDPGPNAHLFGDVQGKADHVTIAGALIDHPHPGAIAKLHCQRFNRMAVPAGQHCGDPIGGGGITKINQAGFRSQFQDVGIGHAGRDGLIFERGQIGGIGSDQF